MTGPHSRNLLSKANLSEDWTLSKRWPSTGSSNNQFPLPRCLLHLLLANCLYVISQVGLAVIKYISCTTLFSYCMREWIVGHISPHAAAMLPAYQGAFNVETTREALKPCSPTRLITICFCGSSYLDRQNTKSHGTV